VDSPRWGRLYADTYQRVGELARKARPMLCGFSACVDINIPLDAALAQLQCATEPAGVAAWRSRSISSFRLEAFSM